MSKTFSGKKVIKILCRSFGFSIISQKGSHVKLQKIISERTITTVVPLHNELAYGTLHSLLKLAEVNVKNFFDAK